MRFKDVKVGDTVYVVQNVRYGFNSSKQFTTPKKVIKVTKTQFTIEDGYRYNKEGRRIGSSLNRAYKYGEDRGYTTCPIIVSDQTKEMEYYISKINA